MKITIANDKDRLSVQQVKKIIKEAEQFADVDKKVLEQRVANGAQVSWSRFLPFTLLSALCSSRIVPAAAFTLIGRRPVA